MLRTIVAGHISFALVNIPVKLYTAARDLTPRFERVHRDCGTPVGSVCRCPKCACDVAAEQIDKVHAVSSEENVVITKEDQAFLNGTTSSGTIDLLHVIDPTEIDLSGIHKSYWLAPDGRDPRGFEVLRYGLALKDKVGIAHAKVQTRTYLSVVRPRSRFLALDLIRYGDEMVSDRALVMPESKPITDHERQLALELLAKFETPFDHSKYPNPYRADLEKLLERKIARGAIRREHEATPMAPPVEARVLDLNDLSDQLMRSLGSNGQPANTLSPPVKTPGLRKAKAKKESGRKPSRKGEGAR
jgi:DNA end-binding protein Ku